MVPNLGSSQINLNSDQANSCAHMQFFVTLMIAFLHFKMAYQFHTGILLTTILCLLHCLRHRLRQQQLLEIWRLRRGKRRSVTNVQIGEAEMTARVEASDRDLSNPC